MGKRSNATNRRFAETPHEKRIDALIAADPTIERWGLGRRFRRIAVKECFATEIEGSFGFVPDAYRLDVEARRIELFEVESTHRLSAGKIRTIALFAFTLDFYDWDVSLFVVDTHGTPPREIDLWPHIMSGFREHAKRHTAQREQRLSDRLQTGEEARG